MVEIVVVGAIIIFILIYNNTIDKNKFIADNEKYFEILREDDYNFLVYARYGEDVDPNQLFRKRIFYAILVAIIFLFIFLNQLSFLNIVFCVVVAVLVFKMPYTQLKSFYKAHLHDIDVMLPYYLKSLEILIQHYISFVTQKFFCFGAINNRRNNWCVTPFCRHMKRVEHLNQQGLMPASSLYQSRYGAAGTVISTVSIKRERC